MQCGVLWDCLRERSVWTHLAKKWMARWVHTLPEEVAFSWVFKLEKEVAKWERNCALCRGNSTFEGLRQEKAWHVLRLGEGFGLSVGLNGRKWACGQGLDLDYLASQHGKEFWLFPWSTGKPLRGFNQGSYMSVLAFWHMARSVWGTKATVAGAH